MVRAKHVVLMLLKLIASEIQRILPSTLKFGLDFSTNLAHAHFLVEAELLCLILCMVSDFELERHVRYKHKKESNILVSNQLCGYEKVG